MSIRAKHPSEERLRRALADLAIDPATRPNPRRDGASSPTAGPAFRAKFVSFVRVFWVGRPSDSAVSGRSIELRPTTKGSSLEGVGLSVSRHPGAWAFIARLSGRVHDMRRRDGKRGRFLLAPHRLEPAVVRWGSENDWCVPASQWKVPSYDGEEDVLRYMVFDSEEEAAAEWDASRDALDNDEGGVQREDSVAATPKLRRRLAHWFLGGAGQVTNSDAEIEVLNLYVAHHYPDLDGVWWDERLDPQALSAPRGVILPHALPRWHVVGESDLSEFDRDG